MMCLDCRNLVPGWIDAELGPLETAEFAAHLSSCRECAEFAGRERLFVQGLRGRLPRPSLPEAERRQILSDLRTVTGSRGNLLRLAWGGALAMAACIALVAGLTVSQARDWTRVYRMDHAAHAGAPDELEYRSGSAAQVAAWLTGAVGTPMHVPTMPDARLLGARTVRLHGRTVALAVYESAGRRLSLFLGNGQELFPARGLAPDQLYTRPGSPYSVVAWIHQGHFHVAVSDLPVQRLQELARQCQKPAT
ncbi:MAG TPA: zf-HC2 domain-containing protein [Fibrobacteria bacterium]|nr:zf-HC2 domain-containing protein [Fibrobacteria bacterium]